ncbi:c-type cytochrome [Brevundimonas sp.]|uniref:c-type cytochrome n=1 Tax=Brevundimonas sp. TaxID=1871086 RepID=UPI002C86FB51|nr:c-type cytochrome [Brevundimonas sp.]HWQ87127.1 c-type cytochrome [Brevundimonas sp.]
MAAEALAAFWLLLMALAGSAPQTADPGQRAFQRCAACHSLGPDDVAMPAPHLTDVFGRRAGAVPGFAYSDAMRAAGRRGLIWDGPTLDRYLADPEAVVPGTAMPYQGGSAAERAALIDWLGRSTGPARNGM